MSRRQDYFHKLLQALHHPEPQTARRAAWILGERGDPAAVAPLVHALESSPDMYFRAAVLEALGKIGGSGVSDVLMKYCIHGALPVRQAAREAVDKIRSKGR